MKKKAVGTVLALALVLALGGCTTRIVTAEGGTPLYTITASGTGTTSAAPDVAEMYFGVTLLATDAKQALAQAGTAAEAMTAAVKGAGVATDDIQTANISVYPQYTYREGKVASITGYSATVQIRVKLREFDAIGDVISAANRAGANEIGGPSFTLSDDASARAESIKSAVADARSRAQAMADAAGKSLGEIVSIGQTGSFIPAYQGGNAYDKGESTVPVEPGKLDVTASVTVVFELK